MNSDESGKWAIFQISPGTVRIEFYSPDGTRTLVQSTFDKPAIREFADRLNEVVSKL